VRFASRITKLEQAAEARARARREADRHAEHRWLVLARVYRAVTPERRARFIEVLFTYWKRLAQDAPAHNNPNAANARPAPTDGEPFEVLALSSWLFGLSPPTRAWFPDPIPVAWLDAVLDIPHVGIWFGCTRCGFDHPNYPSSGPRSSPWVPERPVFETCTYCGGPVVYGGGNEYHCTRQLPLFGEELLAGRDPCADYALPHVSAAPRAQP
jgi:hypothetical protein